MWKLGLVILLLAGCEILSPTDPPFADCSITQITGTWQTTYLEVDGTCGAIPSEINLISGSDGPSGSCTLHNSVTSPDNCRVDIDFECESGLNTSDRWTGLLEMKDYDLVEGLMAGQHIIDGSTTCRSTYEVTMTKL